MPLGLTISVVRLVRLGSKSAPRLCLCSEDPRLFIISANVTRHQKGPKRLWRSHLSGAGQNWVAAISLAQSNFDSSGPARYRRRATSCAIAPGLADAIAPGAREICESEKAAPSHNTKRYCRRRSGVCSSYQGRSQSHAYTKSLQVMPTK